MEFRGRYEKLVSGDDQKGAARGRSRFLMKKLSRRVKGLKLTRCRKLNWKTFSMMLTLSRKIGEAVRKMKMDEACPAIVFSCQWGLPVLSHSSSHVRWYVIIVDLVVNCEMGGLGLELAIWRDGSVAVVKEIRDWVGKVVANLKIRDWT
ncbi:hypothetical protein BUALT_Bualt19G0078500 [Buddleja alternifolia]|uniref:Uncharacterized protein n=1 Tax=Buddleja alternifolia TaxID=168488 RepID=A0AAV6W9K6_9LAMI|nr:hypothetical protein BUALT_Bualt19G0078500 [Buddleja alternifolia]